GTARDLGVHGVDGVIEEFKDVRASMRRHQFRGNFQVVQRDPRPIELGSNMERLMRRHEFPCLAPTVETRVQSHHDDQAISDLYELKLVTISRDLVKL